MYPTTLSQADAAISDWLKTVKADQHWHDAWLQHYTQTTQQAALSHNDKPLIR